VLAELLLKAIEENFSKEVLSRLCGVAADGPYQASSFRRKLVEALNIVETGVKDSKSPSGIFFQRFLKLKLKLKLWWPKVKSKLTGAVSGDKVYFPRLQQAGDLKPGGEYKGVELLEGWLVSKDEGKEAGGSRFTWKVREENEIREDHKRLAQTWLLL